MKHILFILACVFTFSVSQAQISPDNSGSSNSLTNKISWKKADHDFGKIKKGKPVSVEFVFTNVSSTPVVIKEVKTSCGCTVANYPKEPVAPHQTAKVTANYNAANLGKFTKTLTVFTTASSTPYTLTLTGTVIE
jgi:hypothetical protein